MAYGNRYGRSRQYDDLCRLCGGGCGYNRTRFPIYFGFKGGKGILVSVAVLMTVEWIPACILLGIFIIVVALTRYVSLGSCIAAVCYPVTILVYSLITGDPCVWINVILSALIAVLILFMHRGNLVRLKITLKRSSGRRPDRKKVYRWLRSQY